MKPIRIALGGSGFKFPAHVGAIHALRDAGYEPVQYAGTSGGAIIATLAACGMDLDHMKHITMFNDWSCMMQFNLWTFLRMRGYCAGNELLRWLRAQTYGRTFDMLKTDLIVMASDVCDGTAFEFSERATGLCEVALAARASASIPLVYESVRIGDKVYEDGGCVNNLPIDQLTVDDIPRLGIQLVAQEPRIEPGAINMLTSGPRVLSMMMDALDSVHVQFDEAQGAFCAFVETGFCSGLDRNMPQSVRQQLFDNGYAAVKSAIEKIESCSSSSPSGGPGLSPPNGTAW